MNEQKDCLGECNFGISVLVAHIIPQIHFCVPKLAKNSSFLQIWQILLSSIFSAIRYYMCILKYTYFYYVYFILLHKIHVLIVISEGINRH